MAVLDFPAEKPWMTVSGRSISDGPKSPVSKPALDHFSPKLAERILSNENILLNDSVVAVASGSAETACGQKSLRSAYSPSPPCLAQPSMSTFQSFEVIRAFPTSELDVSADLPSVVLDDFKTVIKPSSTERTYTANGGIVLSGELPQAPSNPTSSSRFSSIATFSLDDHAGASQDGLASTTEKVLIRDLPSPHLSTLPCPPKLSPSFEVIRIFPCGDVEFSDAAILPPSLKHFPARRGPSPLSFTSKNSELEQVVLIALAWTFAFTFGFGFLLLLAEWTHNAYACSLMVVLSLNLGAYLVMNNCVMKQISVSRVRNPTDVTIRSRDLGSAGNESPEDGHSSFVQINGRFEISSFRSSQDIFRSELLMNGQVISSTPRRDTLYPGTPTTLTSMSSNTGLTIFGMAGTSSERGLRTRQTPHASTPSGLDIMQTATSKVSKTA